MCKWSELCGKYVCDCAEGFWLPGSLIGSEEVVLDDVNVGDYLFDEDLNSMSLSYSAVTGYSARLKNLIEYVSDRFKSPEWGLRPRFLIELSV